MKRVSIIFLTVLAASSLLFIEGAFAEETVEFTVVVESGAGVVNAEGEAASKGDEVTQDNIDDFTFGDGASLVVVNKATGIKYSIANAVDLAFLGNALGTKTNGVAIGRWVVGGGVRSIERSSLLSLGDPGSPLFVPRATIPTLPAVSPAGP